MNLDFPSFYFYKTLETLRKYPPKTILTRFCTRPFQLPDGQYTLKIGTPIVFSILGWHHDSKYFRNPLQFNPDRFHNNPNPIGYFPYGAGPRACIGKNLANLIMISMLAFILSKYNVRLGSGTTSFEIDFNSPISYQEQIKRVSLEFGFRFPQTDERYDTDSDTTDDEDEDHLLL